MSDIQNSNSSDLTAYNVDGLELFFTASRKARASYRAIARMCETSPSNIHKMLGTADHKDNVVMAEVQTSQGLRTVHTFPSVTIVACLAKYNPIRLSQFVEFGIDEGLAQMAGVPVATVTQVPNGYVMPKTSELLAIAAQLAKEDENRQTFLSDKPGLKAMDDLAKADKGLTLCGSKFIVTELAEEMGLELTRYQSAGVSAMLGTAVLTQNLEAPTKRYVQGKRKQGYYVNEYSYDVKSVALDCMKHMKLI